MGLQELRNIRENRDKPKEKKVYRIPKVSAKRQSKIDAEKKANSVEGKESELDLWFAARRLEMTGRCMLCSGKTEKNNDVTYRRSIHHLLDKRKAMFPSVATHEHNWLELCHFGNSCHTAIHNSMITWELLFDSTEWPIISDKLKKVLPFVAESEKHNKAFSKIESLVYGNS